MPKSQYFPIVLWVCQKIEGLNGYLYALNAILSEKVWNLYRWRNQ